MNLLAELAEVLNRKKFLTRLQLSKLQPLDLVNGYAALATPVQPATIPPVIVRDPDDDALIACAVSARATVIISGDHDLLDFKKYQEIEMMTSAEFLKRLT